MSDKPEPIRTPQQIIDEFADQAISILSGNNARTDKNSLYGGEVGTKFVYVQSVVTRGRGHSVKTAADGSSGRIDL